MEAGTAMSAVGLDLSTKTGWSIWFHDDINAIFDGPNWAKAVDRLGLRRNGRNWHSWGANGGSLTYGCWHLSAKNASLGAVFDELHENLAALFDIIPFDELYFEEAINLHQNKNTSAHNIELALGLQAHVLSFARRFGLRKAERVNVNTWRPDFCGRQATQLIKRECKLAERSARDPLKAATMARCRHLGLSPRNPDEGDAIGVLTSKLVEAKNDPPWWEPILAPAPLLDRASA